MDSEFTVLTARRVALYFEGGVPEESAPVIRFLENQAGRPSTWKRWAEKLTEGGFLVDGEVSPEGFRMIHGR